MKCAFCGAPVSPSEAKCPYCLSSITQEFQINFTYKLPPPPEPFKWGKSEKIIGLGTVLSALVVFALGLSLYFH